jgi:hypothetical protein
MAERFAESVDCDVDASLEGTERLEQEFSLVRRTLNNNDTNDRSMGKITLLLNQELDSPVAEPKVPTRRVTRRWEEQCFVWSMCRTRSTWTSRQGRLGRWRMTS